MILHIIRKDLHLLWPFVAAVAALNAVGQWMRYRFVLIGNDSGWLVVGSIATIAWVVLVAMLVHQDVIPGTRQDWLTRPIKRRDLVAAKLLFVVALLHVPLFVIMTIEVLATGYPLSDAIGAAFVRGISIFIVITLPAVALAAITRTFVELVITGLVVAVVAETAATMLDAITGEPCGATCGSGLAWVGMAARLAVVVAAGVAVIALQYFRRGAMSWARAVVVVAAVGFVIAGRLAWSSAFAIQRAVTGAAAEPVSLALSLDRDRSPAPRAVESMALRAARNRLAGMDANAGLEQLVRREIEGTTISLPLRAVGQRAGTVVWADRSEIRLLDAGGRTVYRGRGDAFELRAGATDAMHTALVPQYVFDAYAGSELRAELDFWLTSLEASGAATLSASGGSTRLDSGEQCTTRPLRAGRSIDFRCLNAHRQPACFAVAVEAAPDHLVCAPSYWPDALWGNLFASFGMDVPIPAGMRVEDATLRVVTYEPRAHFTAELVVPQFRLADWAVRSQPASANQ